MTILFDKFGMRSIGHFIIIYRLSNSYHTYLIESIYSADLIYFVRSDIYPFYVVIFSHVALVSDCNAFHVFAE